MNKVKTQGGQALLIVLLALAAVASVALTVSNRSTVDVAVTTDVEDSQRAFTAAEAGIEKTLLDESGALAGTVQESVGNAGAIFRASADAIPENRREYVYPFDVSAGDVATLWFMSHDANNLLSCTSLPCYTGSSVRICWGTPGVSATDAGALEISIYHENPPGNLVVTRTTVEPDPSRRSSNNFALPAGPGTNCGTVDGVAYAHTRIVDFTSLEIPNFSVPRVLKMMRVRFLYNPNPQPVAFTTREAGVDLPVQGVRIDSLGSAGTASRRLEAYTLYPSVPGMFEAALYSPPGVNKN